MSTGEQFSTIILAKVKSTIKNFWPACLAGSVRRAYNS